MKCYNCGFNQLVCESEKDIYICKKCGYQYPKQYFFISHSHKDIEKVRIIRNIIEETFFYEPILFFLKCLSDDTELTDLLKREISERIWFVYCKSENAEKSKYVQFEREYINQLINSGKKIHVVEVDIDKYEVWDEKCAHYIRSQIEYKIRKTQLFLSYARQDGAIANTIYSALKDNSFSVFRDNDLGVGTYFNEGIDCQIKNSSYKNGAILLLVTKDYLNSQYAVRESEYAFSQGACIIPIILVASDEQKPLLVDEFNQKFRYLADREALIINVNNLQESIDELISYLLKY